MLISTRGRYALRALIYLAEHRNGGYIAMKEIANKQGISLKYLEQIIPVLSKHGIIEGVQGKGGGYKLIKSPEKLSVGEVLRLTEGDLAPVACLKRDVKTCDRAYECRTYPMWVEFYRIVNEFFDGKTLADLVVTNVSDNYSI